MSSIYATIHNRKSLADDTEETGRERQKQPSRAEALLTLSENHCRLSTEAKNFFVGVLPCGVWSIFGFVCRSNRGCVVVALVLFSPYIYDVIVMFICVFLYNIYHI